VPRQPLAVPSNDALDRCEACTRSVRVAREVDYDGVIMNDKKLFELAKAGKVDAILEATSSFDEDDEDGDVDGAQDSYKWLQVAADFGAKRASKQADELLGTTSLKYDDGDMVIGLIHLELGQAYLRGEAPLPVDHAKAKRHLGLAKDAAIHVSTDAAKSFPAFRKKLRAEACAVFDAYFPAKGAPAAKKAKKAPAKKTATAKKAATARAAPAKKKAPAKK